MAQLKSLHEGSWYELRTVVQTRCQSPVLGAAPLHNQFRRSCRLCGCSFQGVGPSAGACSRATQRNRRAIYLVFICFSHLGCVYSVESDLGWVHRCPPTTTKWHLVVDDNPRVACRNGSRFHPPLITQQPRSVLPATRKSLFQDAGNRRESPRVPHSRLMFCLCKACMSQVFQEKRLLITIGFFGKASGTVGKHPRVVIGLRQKLRREDQHVSFTRRAQKTMHRFRPHFFEMGQIVDQAMRLRRPRRQIGIDGNLHAAGAGDAPMHVRQKEPARLSSAERLQNHLQRDARRAP